MLQVYAIEAVKTRVSVAGFAGDIGAIQIFLLSCNADHQSVAG
jgi:hypothetical protein